MNDNSLSVLLNAVEPKIQNIDKNRVEVKSLSDVHETMENLVELGQKNYKEILDFYDQDFIYKAIKIGNANSSLLIDKYESSKYLLKNDDPILKDLPQYKDSVKFMESMYEYLYGLNQKINLDYETKKEQLEKQELLNKYFYLLKQDNIFIKDIDEFLTFLDLNKLDIEERLKVLIQVNKCNVKNYITTNDIEITSKIKLSDVSILLKKNNSLLNEMYEENDEINKPVETYLQEDNFEEKILNKKIYLIHKIKKMYDEQKYTDLISDYLEFYKTISLEKEKEKQEIYPRKLCFLFDDQISFIRKYLESADDKYKSCILKNLLDIENDTKLVMPYLYYNDNYVYLQNDFIVKTVYMFLENGNILILGVLEPGSSLEEFLDKKKMIILDSLKKEEYEKNKEERDILLKNIKLEDLVLTMDLDTLNVKMEDKDARETA